MLLSLKNKNGFSWYKNERIFIKGYFFDTEDNFYQNDAALLFLSDIKKEDQFLKTIKAINGCFTIVIKTDTTSFIASDTTRVFPLFYTFQNNNIHISDDISLLKEEYNLQKYDALAETTLKSSLHTYGNKTLLKNVYQVQSNEYLCIENEKITTQDFFFTYSIQRENTDSFEIQKATALTVFENTFKRLIPSLNNRTVALPLSGGFDSRLIAVLLKKYNYTNVICYTYGKKSSLEINNSKKVAKALGFKWHFIEYSDDLINNFENTETFRTYAHYAGKFSAMPNLQEYFAVKYLKEQQLIPDDAIFSPGYAGDLLGGSQFLKIIPEGLEKDKIIPLIIKEKFTNCKLTNKDFKLIEKELTVTLNHKIYQNKIPYSIFEDIDIKEKIAKYIFNSASFYSFFGYEHRFPFWDKELLNFFKLVPEKHKIMKVLFDDVLINNYFKPFNVYFEEELQPTKTNIISQKVKEIIRPFLPTFIKKKFLQKNNFINYQLITKKLETHLQENCLQVKKQLKSYNEVIVQWYIFYAKEKFK